MIALEGDFPVDKKEHHVDQMQKLITRGQQQGSLSYREIMDTLQEIELDPDQIDDFYEHLAALGIDVIDDDDEAKQTDEQDDNSLR